MKVFLVLASALLCAIPAYAQPDTLGCPLGTPAAFWPGPAFVPDTTCQGWVPRDHPLAKRPAALSTTQDIYSRLEFPAAGARVEAVRSFSGWAFDCALGTLPPVFRLVETKPDGSLREVPNDFQWVTSIPRPDVNMAHRATCPALLNVPLRDGSSGGYNDLVGWSLQLRSPITEPGMHTFTVLWSWPAQNHAGSMTIAVRVQ